MIPMISVELLWKDYCAFEMVRSKGDDLIEMMVFV